MGWGKFFTSDDASKLTGDSEKKVSEAWHESRTDSGVREGKDKELFRNDSDAPEGYKKEDTHPDKMIESVREGNRK